MNAPPPTPKPDGARELDRLTRILPGHPDLVRELRRPTTPQGDTDRLQGEGGPGDRCAWP